jgi:hypothetical protein
MRESAPQETHGRLVDARDEPSALDLDPAALDQLDRLPPLRSLDKERRELAGLDHVERLDAELGREAVRKGERAVGMVDLEAAVPVESAGVKGKEEGEQCT